MAICARLAWKRIVHSTQLGTGAVVALAVAVWYGPEAGAAVAVGILALIVAGKW